MCPTRKPLQPASREAVAYIRVSTEDQVADTKTSLRDQREAVEALAKKLAKQVGNVFEDPGFSGATAEDRPGFMELVRFCESNPRPRSSPGFVLVLNDSRWGRFRNPDEAAYWRVALSKCGWEVRFAEGDDTTDPLARGVIRTIYSAQASAYREAISANAKRGARGTASQGYWQVEAPIGYRRRAERDGKPGRVLDIGQRKAADEKVRLVRGPKVEQDFVRWLFETYANGGESLGSLVRKAQERFPKRKWSRRTVGAVLKNPVYCGDVVWCRRPHDKLERAENSVRDPSEWVVVRDAHDSLISRALFARVQERLKLNKKQTSATRGGYPLSGLIRCSQCGEPYTGAGGPRGPPGDPDRYRFYRDRGGVEPNPRCQGFLGTLQKRFVEPMVVKAIGEVVSHPVVQELIEREFNRALGNLAARRDDIRQTLQKEYKRLHAEKKRLVQAIARGTLADEDVADELTVIRDRLKYLKGELEAERFKVRQDNTLQEEKTRLLALAADFPGLAKRLEGPALKELIRPWVEDAVVDKQKRTLTLTIRRVPEATTFLVLNNTPRPMSAKTARPSTCRLQSVCCQPHISLIQIARLRACATLF